VQSGSSLNHPSEFLAGLYRTMLRIRFSEESLVAPIVSKEVVCPVHLYSGQEAIAAGVCAALGPRDYVFGTHRSHGHYLARGGSMNEMVAEIFCRATGCAKGKGGSMHLVAAGQGFLGSAPIVAGTISLALGAALASSIRRDDRVTVSFFGDGATGEGVLYEALNFAALRSLPIVFACENNLYATHMPIRACRPTDDIYEVAIPFGIESRRIDGNDVLAVYEAARTAVEQCRSGHGPRFLEFLTYRLRGHVGPDDNIQGTRTDIRPPEELEHWRRKDPITRLEGALLERGSMSQEQLRMVKLEVEQEVLDALTYARSSPSPQTGEVTKHVFRQ